MLPRTAHTFVRGHRAGARFAPSCVRVAGGIGMGRTALSRAVRDGWLRHLARGLYAVGEEPATPELRHLELCRALRLEYPDAVLGGHSAVVALGLPTWRVALEEHSSIGASSGRSGGAAP